MSEEGGKGKLVVCVGNLLCQDEGFGPYLARVLTDADAAAQHFDEEHVDRLQQTFCALGVGGVGDGRRIPVLDAGTMGMSLIPYIRDYDEMVIADVVDCGPSAKPGTCYTFTPEEMAANGVMHSLHDMRIPDVLTNARLAGHDCEVKCVGVQKGHVAVDELTIGLTPEVEAATPYAVGAVIELLRLDI